MLSSLRTNAACLISTIAAWGGLLGIAFGLVPEERVDGFLVFAVFPSLAIFFGFWALRLLAQCGKASRVSFWVLSILGALILTLFCQGHAGSFGWLNLSANQLWGSMSIPLLVGSWILYRVLKRKKRHSEQRLSLFSSVCDCALAGGIVLVIIAVGLFGFKLYASRAQDAGLKRWAEIGRPMPEFKQNLKPIEENDSLNSLLADLKPYGMRSLYKEGTLKYSHGPANQTARAERPGFGSPDVLALCGSWNTPGDTVVMPAEKCAEVASREGELSELYRSILSRPAPVWEYHPSDGFALAVPNFLFLRQMAQTIAVDAALRLSRGDREGAASAIAAGLRVSESLRESPVLVSCMIRAAIEGLFAPLTARLQEEPDGWERLARDAAATRASLKNCIQAENLLVMNLAEGPEQDFSSLFNEFFGPKLASSKAALLKSLFSKFLARSLIRLESGHAAMVEAGMVDYLEHRDLQATVDDSNRIAQELTTRYPCVSAPNFIRAGARVEMMLLLKEQAQMIRYARAEMAAGKLGLKGEHPSVVIPGAKWEITANGTAHTVSLKLTPTPGWAIKSDVADDKFLLLPLDGSKSWKFDLP